MFTPFSALITACLDGNMRAYRQKRLLWTFRGTVHLGLKQLDYTEHHGAALLVHGFESVFKVWNLNGS